MEILVVEDEAGIADFLARGLAAEGYEVALAADGVTGERMALGPNKDPSSSTGCFRAVTELRYLRQSGNRGRRCR